MPPKKSETKTPITSARHGETYSGEVIAITRGGGNAGEGPAILIRQGDSRVWVNLRKPDFKLILAGLGPDPLDGRRFVMATMGRHNEQRTSEPVASDVTVYAAGAI